MALTCALLRKSPRTLVDSVLLGGGGDAIVPITCHKGRISYWPNKIRYFNYFGEEKRNLFILKLFLNFYSSECNLVLIHFKGDVVLQIVLLLLTQHAHLLVG